jgi:hypothetical protein
MNSKFKSLAVDLANTWKGYLQSLRSDINPYNPNEMFDIWANAESMQFLDLYANLENIRQSCFVQNYVGDQCDIGLYEKGLPARGGETYGYCAVAFDFVGELPLNTIFQSEKGQQYQVLQNIEIILGVDNYYTLYAVNSGNSTYVSKDEILYNINDRTQTCVVLSSTIGQVAESDQSCNLRIQLTNRTNNAPGNISWYVSACLLANSELPISLITQGLVVPNYITYNNIKRLGVFPLSGASITEFTLNQGLLPTTTFLEYNREVNDEAKNAVNAYIQNGSFLMSNPIVGKCKTWFVNSASVAIQATTYNQYTLKVSLSNGIGLDTIIGIQSQNADLTPTTINLSVVDLVKRSFRYAVCNYTYPLENEGKTIINTNGDSIIPVSTLLSVIDEQLGSNGSIAQFLLNIELFDSNGVTINEIKIPSSAFLSVDDVYFVYDIKDYTYLTVVNA